MTFLGAQSTPNPPRPDKPDTPSVYSLAPALAPNSKHECVPSFPPFTSPTSVDLRSAANVLRRLSSRWILRVRGRRGRHLARASLPAHPDRRDGVDPAVTTIPSAVCAHTCAFQCRRIHKLPPTPVLHAPPSAVSIFLARASLRRCHPHAHYPHDAGGAIHARDTRCRYADTARAHGWPRGAEDGGTGGGVDVPTRCAETRGECAWPSPRPGREGCLRVEGGGIRCETASVRSRVVETQSPHCALRAITSSPSTRTVGRRAALRLDLRASRGLVPTPRALGRLALVQAGRGLNHIGNYAN
ncbi:hypothetical protein DFH07DRAFT_2808 [Mycena maculata]|uniref:Uncharacterized protein n=1 Tax=Mycena maculata TaxID=230809 RepID=A0AAD7P2J8_9AGAR|nr:hypothetical protein DFH07DRAFT_2808 [Mycena maculata]